MRSKLIAVAIAAGLGVTSFTVAAAPAQKSHNRTTAPAASNAEVEALKAQLAALQSKVDELEQRTDAQSDINVSTGQAVETVQKAQATSDKKVASVDKLLGNTSLSGKMFFDFTNISDKNSDKGKTDKSGTGIDVKRFYLGVTHKFNDVWSANLTTDFNYASAIGQTSLYVKKAYVQGKFDDAAVLRIGSADLPWVPFAENYYGFRYVENTLIDRLKYGTSADWGLHMGGELGASKSLNYAVSVVNGAGYKNPSRTKGVDFEGRVGFVPFDNMIVAVGGYSGHLGKETQNISAPHTAQRGDFMVAYADKSLRLGAEYFTAKNWNNVLSPLSDKADGYSLWGSVLVADGLTLFTRYDNAKVSKNLDHNAKDVYYNLGLEYQVTKGFKLAGVWKHEKADKSVTTPVPPHVQNVKTNEIGVFGEVSF
ncbi:porin [Rhodanobacter sp. FW510-R12]|uniref:porin n=1 Tax=unclassified Rhodanobacter TaxID=2621553 RepID=UPI0007AA4644|nr:MULTISPECIES: porin [unclassified Rhodanobacter]KZC16051.1 porin [Rhodanobacter sp. FW104-R8]KZC26590.1 porin [Rhodanobacter sp. FW510-T8]KZC30459.1 porin [Rhodanobacter sp. FW510-R10]